MTISRSQMSKQIEKRGSKIMKKVPAKNKGLKKLPTAVRNKMGYMKKGGGVMKKKGYAKGGAVMKKKGYAKGGAVKKMMGGGAAMMRKKGMKKGGAVRKRK